MFARSFPAGPVRLHAQSHRVRLTLLAVILAIVASVVAPAQASGQSRLGAGQTELRQGGDPAARVQLVITSIDVANDRDGTWTGAGDFTLTASLWRCSAGPDPCSASEGPPAEQLAALTHKFSADTGDKKTLNLLMPTASQEDGIPLHAGRTYKFQLDMFERDVSGGDFMGGVQRTLDQSNGWGVGLHEREPAAPFVDKSLHTGGLVCAGCGGIVVGDFLVTYEIRLTPLPDLRPTAIRVVGAEPGDTSGLENVCLAVQNAGVAESGPFGMALYLENTLASNGGASVVGLAAGASHESCIRTFLPTSGTTRLRLVVDQSRAVAELNELNNFLDDTLDRGPAPSPSPELPTGPATSSPSTGQSSATQGGAAQKPAGPMPMPSPAPVATGQGKTDLTVSAVRVNGQAPDGKNDCQDGKNVVTAIVKSAGTSKAGGFVVRLLVDGDEAAEATVDGLDAGKEREVRFGDVRLKKGEHKLTAIADAKGALAESNEENNERQVAAQCRGDE